MATPEKADRILIKMHIMKKHYISYHCVLKGTTSMLQCDCLWLRLLNESVRMISVLNLIESIFTIVIYNEIKEFSIPKVYSSQHKVLRLKKQQQTKQMLKNV